MNNPETLHDTGRKTMYRFTAICFIFALVACAPEPQPRDFSELDIETLQTLMEQGELSSEQLTGFYLDRIDTVDRNGPALNSIIEVNPDALDIARALDRERAVSGARGPLHGIPVVLKANIDTADRMDTTAGSLALVGHKAPADAFLVAQLREAGAVLLAKANLSEWANFRSTKSSSGWSSVGGQTRNAYDPSRNPCGSSSGSAVAVAASLASVAIGTETDGSIVCPSSVNGIVGIKPSLGLVSRSGIIPIAHSQDTAGPMARTVRDAAILLNAIVAKDEQDPAVGLFPGEVPDFTAGLIPDALQGARIGVIRSYGGAGNDARVDAILDSAAKTLEAHGAEIVDGIEIDTEGMDDAEYEVLLYEFKADLNAWLEQSGAPLSTLAEIIAFNRENADRVMPIFQQEILEAAQQKGPLSEPAYLDALATSKRIAQQGIDDVMAEHGLDALVAPTRGPAWMTDHVNGDQSAGIYSSSYAAVSGYASITVPAGQVAGLPIGISFIGGALSDARLIGYAFAFEQVSAARRPPPLD
jgi:amidase